MALKIQFRESDEQIERYLEEKGLNPNEVAREAFEAHVRALVARDRRERLAARGARLPPGAAEAWTREERET